MGDSHGLSGGRSAKRPAKRYRRALGGIIRLADQMAASEIIKPDQANQTVWIARLKQRRYWTSSQARLLAERIVWKHLDDLLGDRAA